MPELTLIIPTYQKKLHLLQLCLSELSRIGEQFHVILVYDRCEEEDHFPTSFPVSVRFKSCQVIELIPASQKQQSRGIELAARYAKTEWLWVQDDDAFMLPQDYQRFLSQSSPLLANVDLITCARVTRLEAPETFRLGESFNAILERCETQVEGSIGNKNAWWFTGQPKLVRRKTLLNVGTFHQEFKHYWWWDVCVGLHFEMQGTCVTLPLRAFLIEHEREDFEAEKEHNWRLLDNHDWNMWYSPIKIPIIIPLDGVSVQQFDTTCLGKIIVKQEDEVTTHE